MRSGIAFVVLLAATVAHAQPPTGQAEASRLFEEGRALVKDGKYAEACERFARSFELERAPGTQLNLGECAERDGNLRKAWLLFDDAAKAYTKLGREPAAKLARDRAVALEPRLATVVIQIAAPNLTGLAVRVGDHGVVPAAQVVEHLDAGGLSVSASAPGHETFSTTISTEVGKQILVVIPALVPTASGETKPIVPALASKDDHRSSSRVKLALGVGVVGGVALVASGILGLSARGKYDSAADGDHCSRDSGTLACDPIGISEIESANTRADFATGAAIAGAAFLAAGAVLYFTAPQESAITPTAAGSSVGLAWSSRF